MVEVAKISSHLNKEANRESVEVYAHQNPCKSSNVETSTIFDYVSVDPSYILFPITTFSYPKN